MAELSIDELKAKLKGLDGIIKEAAEGLANENLTFDQRVTFNNTILTTKREIEILQQQIVARVGKPELFAVINEEISLQESIDTRKGLVGIIENETKKIAEIDIKKSGFETENAKRQKSIDEDKKKVEKETEEVDRLTEEKEGLEEEATKENPEEKAKYDEYVKLRDDTKELEEQNETINEAIQILKELEEKKARKEELTNKPEEELTDEEKTELEGLNKDIADLEEKKGKLDPEFKDKTVAELTELFGKNKETINANNLKLIDAKKELSPIFRRLVDNMDGLDLANKNIEQANSRIEANQEIIDKNSQEIETLDEQRESAMQEVIKAVEKLGLPFDDHLVEYISATKKGIEIDEKKLEALKAKEIELAGIEPDKGETEAETTTGARTGHNPSATRDSKVKSGNGSVVKSDGKNQDILLEGYYSYVAQAYQEKNNRALDLSHTKPAGKLYTFLHRGELKKIFEGLHPDMTPEQLKAEFPKYKQDLGTLRKAGITSKIAESAGVKMQEDIQAQISGGKKVNKFLESIQVVQENTPVKEEPAPAREGIAPTIEPHDADDESR